MGALLGKTIFFGRQYAGKLDSPFRGIRWAALFGVLIIWFLYLRLIDIIGFYVSSFLMVLALTIMLRTIAGEVSSGRSLSACLAYSVLYSIATYLVFHLFFGIVTPAGLLV